jgi:uncharacterized membrane protein
MTPTFASAVEPTRQSLLRRLRQRHPHKIIAAAAVGIYAVISHSMLQGEGPVRVRVDLAPLLQSPLVLQAHVAGATLAFAIGCVLLAGVKGRSMHRTLGYVWVAAMVVTAISSFFLKGLNSDGFSIIHALSAWTMIVLPMGLAAARRKNIAKHRKEMTGLFMGGLVVAGLFSFLPGRLMWHLFFTV